jgi:hypothetical protein
MSMVTLKEGVIMGAIREDVAKIMSGIDLEKAKGVCQENIRFAGVEAAEIKEAAICVHEGQHALQMKFGLSGILNVVLDFRGNCVPVEQPPTAEASSPEQKIEEASSQAAQAHQQL